ncbi:aminopeptidase P family protein [bacterium]|nr:aminopeptidase P family protein [bacterium]
MELIQKIQNELKNFNLDGWLFYDFRGTNILARRILKLPEGQVLTRRYLYFVPEEGKPTKIVHKIEAENLDSLEGEKITYSTWQEFAESFGKILKPNSKIAIEFSPKNAIPYVSRVDAGTVDLVRSFGVEVVSSADLVQIFEAVWDDYKWQTHKKAAKLVMQAKDGAFRFIRYKIEQKQKVTEYEVQQFILEKFAESGLVTDHSPIVAVNQNSGNPHYEPTKNSSKEIRENDFVLIDLWAKLNKPNSVFADYTWVGFVGKNVPEKFTEIFKIVAGSRDAAVDFLKEKFAANEKVEGWQVDRVTRNFIEKSGYGEFFIHRTGHSIGEEGHGNGANIDDLENHDTRQILKQTCFSIEPGIYLEDFGVRTEINVFVTKSGEIVETGTPKQTKIIAILGF